MRKDKTIWITWENHRRSFELSKALGTKLYILENKNNYFFRIIYNSIRTVILLFKEKPMCLIAQNPSIILAFLACLIKGIFKYRLVVDRHSNFKFHTIHLKNVKYKIFHFLSRYTIRKADLTIITNDFLKNYVDSLGGKGFVLQDKMPNIESSKKNVLRGKYNILFPCSFSEDEPIENVIIASRNLDKDIYIYITGNPKNKGLKYLKDIPKNVILTGFVNESEYQTLLKSCDVVLSLTNQDHTLLCSAYEAVVCNKPLLLSKKKSLGEYFYKGRILTNNEPDNIIANIGILLSELDKKKSEVSDLAEELMERWKKSFKKLKELINTL